MTNSKNFKLMFWTVWLLVAATLVYVLSKINFIFYPFTAFVSTIFAPMVIAGFFYYLLDPVVQRLEKMNIKRSHGIFIVLLLFLGLILFFVVKVVPTIIDQIAQLIGSLPFLLASLDQFSRELASQPWFEEVDLAETLERVDLSIESIADSVLLGVTSSLGAIFGIIADATIVLITVPIVLVYMFRDGKKFRPAAAKLFPKEYRGQMIELMGQMNDTISSYISGQALVCLFVGICTYLGYLLIGMPYGLLLGIIAGITNIIPYLGPFIGAAPALVIGLTVSPLQALWAAIVVLIIQQIESNLISPQVLGKVLSIHPLTIIVLLLVAGNIAGVLGMLLGVPVYAVTKTIVLYVKDMILLQRRHKTNNYEKF